MKQKIKEVLTQCAISALGSFLVSVGNGLSAVVQEQASAQAAEKVSKVDWNEALKLQDEKSQSLILDCANTINKTLI